MPAPAGQALNENSPLHELAAAARRLNQAIEGYTRSALRASLDLGDAVGLIRTLNALLGPRVIRLIDGLHCPHCGTKIVNYPEETNTGWRLTCRNCHGDLLDVDEGDLLVAEDEEPTS
jgi:hypothetical protein